VEDKTRLRLLIVEDNPADAELVRERLTEVRGRAFDIRQARTAAEAEYLLLAEAVDAVLLDLDLSDSEGIATVRRIRSVNERVPVVVLSGHVRGQLIDHRAIPC
jgi:DNA-binding response OmpR family regulator